MFNGNYPCILINDLNYELEVYCERLLLASAIVDGTFNFFQIKRIFKTAGRNPFDLKNMIKLIYFGSIDKIQSSI